MIFEAIGSLFGGSKAADAQMQGQDLAIQELRRQFGITQENLNPFIQAGQNAIPGIVQGSTPGGLDERLAEIFNTDIFGSLVDERTRSAQGQLAAGGLTRSGTALQEITDVPTQIGLMIESLLADRQTNLAGSGMNAAQGLGALGGQNSQAIAGLLSDQGGARASGILADNQAGSKVVSGALSALFSDHRLKQHIEMTGAIADLGVFKWNWIPEAEGTIVAECATVGFMANEVKQKYPQHVGEFGGFDVIFYKDLLNELESKCQH